jgi:acetate kinase
MSGITNTKHAILTLNGGSSSIKFSLFEGTPLLRRILEGKVEGIGSPSSAFNTKSIDGIENVSRQVDAPDFAAAANVTMDWLRERIARNELGAIGHRVVHGGPRYWEAERVTSEMLEVLRELTPLDPEHLPGEILLAEIFHQHFSNIPQVACFDTAFHREMPRVAKLLPIPRRYQAKGIQRYGFHGLSYAYLIKELTRIGDPAATKGRVILAHLGNGASLAAVRDGKSIDTSMAFTPTAGLPMSTRSGDLDPGLVGYLARTDQMTAAQFHKMVNHESGLLGVSETSSDMRYLLAQEANEVRAGEAVSLFCYQAKKWIGSFASALGGLDTLVFAGGIGENAPLVRARICEGLGFLGIEIDENQNVANASVISPRNGRVAVRVIPTDEERMIAEAVLRVLGL